MALSTSRTVVTETGLSTTSTYNVGGVLAGVSNLHTIGYDVVDSNTGTGVTVRSTGNAVFSGVITATKFVGDGSSLEGVSSSGIGTPLSDDDTSDLNKIYYANQELVIDSTVTVNHPDTGIAAYTHYQDLVVKDSADFIVADGDTFIPDVLGINTSSLPNPVSSATGGRIRAGTITNAGANGAVNFPNGITATGVVTATTFVGNLTGNPTGSGANLTNLPAAQLTGTLPAIDGSSLTGVGASFGNSSINTSGIITATAFVPTTQGQLSHRNVWMNGEFSVAQRATQQTSVTSISGYATGGPDRCFIVITNHGTWTIKQGTDAPPGFQNCMEMIATTGDSSVASNASVRWWQRFEGQDVQRFMKGTSSAKQFAISFYIKAKQTGTYAFELLDYDSSQRHMVKTYTVDAAETWEYKTIIFPGDTTGPFDNDNQMSLAAEFWLVAGTDYTSGGTITDWATLVNNKRAGGHTVNAGASNNDYVRITGVQLEVGPVSTPYEHRSYADELARCHRYFYKSDGEADSGFRYWSHPYGNNAARRVTIMHPQTMRVAPTFTNLLHDEDSGSDKTDGQALYNSNQQWTFAVDVDSSSGWARIERWWASADL